MPRRQINALLSLITYHNIYHVDNDSNFKSNILNINYDLPMYLTAVFPSLLHFVIVFLLHSKACCMSYSHISHIKGYFINSGQNCY